MQLAAPEWLVLIPIVLVVGWYWPQARMWSPLRALSLILVIIALVRPQMLSKSGGIDLWVLVDRSSSASSEIESRLKEWEEVLTKSKSKHDRLYFVDFAGEVVVREEGDASVYSGDTESTKLNLAIHHVLTRASPGRHSRIFVLTDGYSTEPLDDAAERLAEQKVSLDYRLISRQGLTDTRVEKITHPFQVQPGEAFILEIQVRGEKTGEVPYEILRDGKPVGRGKVLLDGGKGLLRFSDRLSKAGAHKYEVAISPPEDEFPLNNTMESWVEVSGGPRIVVVTNYKNDPLARILSLQGFQTDVVLDPSTVNVGILSGAKAVVLNNVPAYELPSEFLDGLEFFIKSQGGGLVMAGGKNSFGSGGYFQSAVDDLLPVSMELRAEHRKLIVSLAIVLDRSGSMAAGVGGGMSKMDLANSGAARSVDLLGKRDMITVFAVDSQAHRFVPLTVIGGNRGVISDAIRSIVSKGGGIFVYTGLKAAWAELEKAPVGQKHIILFADAADAEEPGEYKKLLAEMEKKKTTVSVIALGRRSDSDAVFLEDVAARGNGRIFFNADPARMPAVFAQETVAIARSAFIEEPTQVGSTGAWRQISPHAVKWPPAVDGYNLSYLKSHAHAALLSMDEYEAPLVAFWNRGMGRSAAVSFPVAGEFSSRVRKWSEYGDFIQTLLRWSVGEKSPDGIGVRARIDGSMLRVDLRYAEQLTDTFSKTPPKLVISHGRSGETNELVWELLKPGHYAASHELKGRGWVRGAIQVGKAVVPFGPLSLGMSPEWKFEKDRVRELKHTAALTGGEERLDLSTVWNAPREATYRGFRSLILWILLFVFLTEALITRIGYTIPEFQIPTSWIPSIGKIKFSRKKKSAEDPPQTPSEPPTEEIPQSDQDRRSRFERAKRRGL